MAPIAVIPSGVRLTLDDPHSKNVATSQTIQLDNSDVESNGPTAAILTPQVNDGLTPDTGSSIVGENDPICIVGMACRLPGGVRSPSDLWNFLVQKKTGQCKVPKERFNIDGFYHPEGDRAGVMDADGGYFLQEDVRQFENSFFGINNLEATYMDPQQRKLLEVVFECFESAGASLDDVSGSNTGVYVGNFTVDFQTMQTRDSDYLHRYSATGSGTAILSNRISHVFNLQGPSFTLDTACSSSIYGLHNAVTALENGECDGAVVAGANLVTAPEQHLGTMKGGVLSATSTCHTFDNSADGYGRAEGVSALYLKRLSSALKDNDNIRAVVRATAINSNGKTPGITQPSPRLQERVIRKAYDKAGLNFAETSYVECHGTGTAVGDPIEVEGISRCFSPREGPPLLLGAVKTNLGHSEAASGISAVIKSVLAFEQGKIPATYGITKLNPKLKLDQWNMKIVTELEDWPTSVRRASINSFGYGGANAHAILESIETYLPGYRDRRFEKPTADPTKMFVLPFSAASDASLRGRVQDLERRVENGVQYGFDELSFTLSNRRSHLSERGFLLVRPMSAKTDFSVEKLITPKNANPCLPLGFVFTGQGAQYAGMGKELLESSDEFCSTIRDLDAVLQGLPEAPTWTLEDTILEPAASSRVNEVTHSQPLCTAVQIGIVELLRSWGVAPDVVVGHSSGEIGAAYAAGLLSAAQAIIVAYYRGYAVGKGTSKGTMMAAGMSPEAAETIIKDANLEDQVVVACVNSPESVTLSGSTQGIDTLLAELQNQKKFARKLQTGGRAYHSHMMQEIGPQYEDLMSRGLVGVPQSSPRFESEVRMFSSVGRNGEALSSFSADSQRYLPASYWRSNLENPVQFSTALKNLASTGKYHLVEIGPHSALRGPINQIRSSLGLPEQDLLYSSTLLRGEDCDKCLKSLAGNLFVHKHSLDFNRVNASGHKETMSALHNLPPYPWNYTSLLWSEPRASVELRNREYVRHELLGSKQLAGNGIEHSWRNILRLNEIPWLEDHKLESQIVFPAAGYLAIATEAICQVKGLRQDQLETASFEFRNVNIQTACVVKPDDKESELHTTMTARKISTDSTSDIWYDFAVSSWTSGESIQHCVGSLRVDNVAPQSAGTVSVDTDGYEKWSMGRWYQKLADGDRERVKPEAVSTTQLLQRVKMSPNSTYPGTYYAAHPLSVDACLQASIMGGTAGNLDTLKAFLPMFISRCRINTPKPSSVGAESYIHTRSTSTGFGTKKISCTLKDASGAVVVDITDARLSVYTGKMDEKPDKDLERHPCLRVVWKPDVLRLDERSQPQLEQYLLDFAKHHPELSDNESVGIASGLLDILGHKNPRLRVLEIGSGCECKSKQWLNILDKDSSFPRCRAWHIGNINDGKLQYAATSGGEEKSNTEPYDALLLPEMTSEKLWSEAPQTLLELLDPHGAVVGRSSVAAEAFLKSNGFAVVKLPRNTLFAVRTLESPSWENREVFIVGGSSKTTPLANALKDHFTATTRLSSVKQYSLKELAKVDVSEKAIIVSLLEMEKPFLATMSPEEMDLLRRFTNKVTDLVWLTGSGMFGGQNPDLTLASGLSRALMLEQPSLRFAILDVGRQEASTDKTALQALCGNVQKALVSLHDTDDKEFIDARGLLQISRFVPDNGLNHLFRRRKEQDPAPTTLEEASPAQLAIKKVGLMDTIHFQQISELETTPPAGFVDIDVKAVSLNAKDIYVLSGKVETKTGTSAIEFSGIVKTVGTNAGDLHPGDRVVVLAPNHFRTTERVPAWACQKMLPEEDFEVMPTLPVIYGTALYALNDRAHLRKGESILIHSGAGAFGMASIAIALRLGAVVYATVSTEEKAAFLMKEFGMPRENIFHSRDSSFVESVNKATNGRGVDVVLNSLIGDLLHASWGCIANFGRFVEVGKRDIVNAGRLDMHMFLKNATFTAFDLTELFYHEDEFYRNIWITKFKEALDLYRAREVKAVPIASFDVSEITQAYRHFSTKDRVGKVVISLQNSKSIVPAVPSKHATTFDPNKTYVLIGCLGGLGRSLSKWMMNRGARNFTFLGRSGCDKPSARELVERLEKAGAAVKVVRGDVVNKEDVVAAVNACEVPIGGVVQAAMGLHEALFSTMPHSAWHTGIQPKWQGTWNLHNALEGHDDKLDFFLMTSSVSGSVGTATESNYCSANGFLDSFARWRTTIGKPTVSLGLGMISEVGYLHENPEIEALLLRKGIQPLNEEEFLQVVDFALAGGSVADDQDYDRLARSHILTGLEPFGLRELMKKGFDINNGTMQDPRTMLLSASLDSDGGESSGAVVTADWSKGLPTSVAKSLATEADAESLNAAVHRLVRKRFSNLILIPLDKVDDHKPLAQYGMDSMIAAEFRTWFWGAFKVDIPFLDILSQSNSLKLLSDFVESKLTEGTSST